MKLLTIADLHLDLHFKQEMDPFANVPNSQLESITHCVLAGDLSNKGHKQWKRCLPWLAERLVGAQIFVMPGNHDYYDGTIDGEEKLCAAATECGAAFIQKSELFYGCQRFLCCTLWTDFEIYDDRTYDVGLAARHMNDYHYIKVAEAGYRRLSPVQTAHIHAEHRDWLNKRLSEPFDGETTVITHHAPHMKALKKKPKMGASYASNLETLITKHKPARWLFRHTHHPVSFDVGRTKLTNVSVGYPGQLHPIDSLDRFVLDLEE